MALGYLRSELGLGRALFSVRKQGKKEQRKSLTAWHNPVLSFLHLA